MKLKTLLRSPLLTVLLFVLAAGLLAAGAIGGIRAARLLEAPSYRADVRTRDIGVTLIENGSPVGWRDYIGERADGSWNENHGTLLVHMLDDDGTPKLGKRYEETLCVKNSGNIDDFVRVILYRWWSDEDGTKRQDLDPSLIRITPLTENGWVLDERVSTPERIVLYYTRSLAPGETSTPFLDGLILDPSIGTLVAHSSERSAAGETVYTTYLYDGAVFHLEAEVDAVQTHNGEDAIRSAWGVDVTVSGDTLALK